MKAALRDFLMFATCMQTAVGCIRCTVLLLHIWTTFFNVHQTVVLLETA